MYHNYCYSVTLKTGSPANGILTNLKSIDEARAAVRRMFGSNLASMDVWEA